MNMFASHIPLSSHDLNIVQDVFQNWCADRRVDPQSDEGKQKAKALIDWFQFGIQGKAELRAMLEPS